MPIPLPNDRKTCAMTDSSKLYFCYIKNIALLHRHMHKVLDALLSRDYLDLSKSQEPQTYKAALALPESAYWVKTIQSKYDFFLENETWNLTKLPLNRKILTRRLIFKIKYSFNGEIQKYNARWVLHRLKQKYDID